MMDINPLNQLYKDLMTIIEKTEIKYKVEADKYETVTIKQNADAYITAMRKEDTFNTYYRYDKGLIAEVCNIVDEDLINEYHYNRNLIPISRRKLLLTKQRQKIIDDYIEMNNYYRMLIGIPNVEEDVEDYIYLPNEYIQLLNIDPSTPIHELTSGQITILTSHGYIDEIINKYPNKKYLKYLGNNKIDLVMARTSHNFALLKIPYGISESLWNSFALMYEQSREYFMTCIYITEYRNIIDYYDNFMAMCVMLMAIQQVIARTMKNVISREFFDEYSVKLLFGVYGVPYNQYMDSATRKQVVQSLNLLVQNKGTNKVLFDIASILGYDRLHIYKYYLMKCQKFDLEGFPITHYKTDETTGETVIDYKNTYDIFFQKVAFDENDAYKAVQNSSNRLPYADITESDPYWVEDAQLEEELYQSEYNYVESKYMGVSITYRMSRLLFENIYLLKMIFEKKDEIPNITIDIPKISIHGTVSLFDAICILCAMTCKQNNLNGEILTSASKIMHVMGFNFEKDYDTIRNEILQNEYLDNKLIDFFKDSTCLTVDRINTLYQNYLNLYDIIVETMSTTNSLEVYEAYKKFYMSLYYTNENREMFNIGTIQEPVYAETFLDYVKYSTPDIYQFIINTDKNNMHEFINHVVNKIKLLIPTLKYLGFFSDSSSVMEEMLLQLIRFFKSYTTDMLDMDVIIILDLKPESMLKFIDKAFVTKVSCPSDSLNLAYSDTLSFTSILRYYSDLKIEDKIHFIHGFYEIFDTCKFIDDIKHIYDNIQVNQEMNYLDAIHNLFVAIEYKESLILTEMIELFNNIKISTEFKFEDFCKLIIKLSLDSHIDLYDMIRLYTSLTLSTELNLHDKKQLQIVRTYLEDKIPFNDMIKSIMSELKIIDYNALIDSISQYSSNEINTMIDIHDKKQLQISKVYLDSKISFKEKIEYLCKDLNIHENSQFMDSLYPIISLLHNDVMYLKDTYKYETITNADSFIKFIDSISIKSLNKYNDNFVFETDAFIASNIRYEEIIKLIDSIRRKTILYTCDNNNKLIDKEHSVNKDIFVRDMSSYIDDAGTYKMNMINDTFRFTDSCKVTYI